MSCRQPRWLLQSIGLSRWSSPPSAVLIRRRSNYWIDMFHSLDRPNCILVGSTTFDLLQRTIPPEEKNYVCVFILTMHQRPRARAAKWVNPKNGFRFLECIFSQPAATGGGQTPGVWNFGKVETMHLLRIMEKHLTI